MTMDHIVACVNVHCTCNQADIQEYIFYLEETFTHLLSDTAGVRDLQRATETILKYGSGSRLRTRRW